MVYYKYKCCVPGCLNRTSIRHRFPNKDDTRFSTWKKLICNPKLENLDNETIRIKFTICNEHFKDECFSPGTKRLNAHSIPSLQLPGANENTGSTTSTVHDIPDTITNDTPTNVSELDINGEDLEVDEFIDEPNSPGNISSGESPLFDCPMCCGKQFSLVDLQQHISRYIWGSLKCPVCDEVCVGLEILAVHLDEHHSDQEMTVSENSLLTNVAKSSVSSEESVNVSCEDVQSQVIEDQTMVLPDVGKEKITVDKSVNSGKSTGGTENLDMGIGVPLKNNNTTSLCTQFSGKNILNKVYRPRILVKNITSMHTSSSSNSSLVKGFILKYDHASNIGTKQKTSFLQSSDQTSFDIIKVYDHNYSQMVNTSFAPVKHTLDAEQKLVTSLSETCENVLTSSTCNTHTRVGALDGVDSNRDISCRKCGISFLSERTYVSHTKQFHSTSDSNLTQHHKTSEKKPPFGQRLSVIRPFTCQICDRLFCFKDALHRHVKSHLKE